MLSTVLCLCAFLLAVHTQDFIIKEDKICKQEGLQQRTCKTLSQCPKAQEGLKNGKRPDICHFEGTEPHVCCHTSFTPLASLLPPAVSKPLSTSKPETSSKTEGSLKTEETVKFCSKSKEKCKEYAKSVFMKAEDPIDGREISKDTCYKVDQLIAGGDPIYAQPSAYPHMALVGYGNKNNISWLCAGSLISQRFVLSGAHCTDSGRRGLARWIRLGDYDIASKRDDDEGIAGSREYEIIERINHPLFKRPSLYNDIALYKLITDVEFNEFIRPICLHTEPLIIGSSAIYSAWGQSERGKEQSKILKQINFDITATKECNDSYKSLAGKNLTEGIIDVSMLCATRQNEKSCRENDSGGPLQIRLHEPYCMYSQVGIKSFSRPCVPNSPEVYTRVSNYVPWIESIVWP